jgi:hypothetical protein
MLFVLLLADKDTERERERSMATRADCIGEGFDEVQAIVE